MILLDTSILSLAFRRRKEANPAPPPVRQLRQLIEGRSPVAIPGIVLQEILSGLRHDGMVAGLRSALAGFPVVLANEADHRSGAQIQQSCVKAGVAAGTVDCLIAGMSVNRDAFLFSLDQDFRRLPAACGLKLVPPLH